MVWRENGSTVPLADDDAAVLSTKLVPHADAFNEIFGARIYRLRALGVLFAIVDPPTHGLHDKGRLLRVRLGVRRRRGSAGVSSDDWSIGVWSYVVTGLFRRA